MGLWAMFGLVAPSALAGTPTDDWGRTDTTRDCHDNCRTFMVNFVVLAPVTFPDADAKMQVEIDILNKHFRTKEGYQLFNFVKKRVTTYEEVQNLRGCRKLKALGHLKHELDSGNHHGERKKAIDECFASDDRGASVLFDHHAINFYVFDNYGSRGSSGSSHHTRSKRWPFLLVDYERLGHMQAVEEHEMGHAFAGLEHVCVLDVAAKGPSPIMATPHRWPGGTSSCAAHGGRMGDRSIGFSDEAASHLESVPHREISQIVAEAVKVTNALGAEGSPPPGSPAQW